VVTQSHRKVLDLLRHTDRPRWGK